jgi:hypothetical protein
MSVCISGPVFRGLHLAPLSRSSEFGPFTTSVQQHLNGRSRTVDVSVGTGRQVAFAQSARHHLFITVERHDAASPGRQLRVHLIDGDGPAERFTGTVENSVFSLASAGGALMVGMLSDSEITGSLVFPDGRAHRFTAEFSAVG